MFSLKYFQTLDLTLISSAIETLPEAIMPVLDYVCKATGMKVTMMVAGPEPA